MQKRLFLILFVFLLNINSFSKSKDLFLKKTIYGNIASKSIVHSGFGKFFAQNMMYRHTITVYNRNYKLIKTISDRVNLKKYGHKKYKGVYKGSPVECTFSHNGKYAWVSNYHMFGHGFRRPGCDKCLRNNYYDNSYVYKINTETLKIESVIEVGSVPKYQAATPDNKYILVSNWSSGTISVIDTSLDRTIRTVYVGRFPRGIEITSDSSKAYIAIMGSYNLAVLDLKTFKKVYIKKVGRSPRHLCLSKDNKSLYVTLNGEGKIAKINLRTNKVIKKIATGNAPRTMVLSGDDKFLYVVNYKSDTFSKVRAEDMKVLETHKTNHHPIGITFDDLKKEVWVACYSGSLMVFKDRSYK